MHLITHPHMNSAIKYWASKFAKEQCLKFQQHHCVPSNNIILTSKCILTKLFSMIWEVNFCIYDDNYEYIQHRTWIKQIWESDQFFSEVLIARKCKYYR